MEKWILSAVAVILLTCSSYCNAEEAKAQSEAYEPGAKGLKWIISRNESCSLVTGVFADPQSPSRRGY